MTTMSVSTQPYKGARDFYPEDMRLRKWLFAEVRSVAERYGYEEYDAPILEPTELYLMKGNQEIIAEQTYTFSDRGNRSVTIRTEMTPTVSRMVAARRQQLNLPLRWYSIPNLWRYERMQRGRLREFWQPNFDLFGIDSVEADAEIIQLADAIMKRLGAKAADYRIRISSRELISYVLETYVGLSGVEVPTVSRLIDKMEKMPYGEFVASLDAILSPSQRQAGLSDRLLEILKVKSLTELPEELAKLPAVIRLGQLLDLLAKMGVASAEFDLTMMRGFDYYTGMVFEVFDTSPENSRSLFGGGRYDGLVGQFGVEPLPTVGFAVSDVSLINFLEVHGLGKQLPTEAELGIILLPGCFAAAADLIGRFREEEVNVIVDYTDRKLGKQIESMAKRGVPYLLVIGDDEIKEGALKLKNLITGKEEVHGLDRTVSIIKDSRRR